MNTLGKKSLSASGEFHLMANEFGVIGGKGLLLGVLLLLLTVFVFDAGVSFLSDKFAQNILSELL